ncbi:MAG: ribosome small subunit-dependent GTPase A [Peptococcaceae bacterium]|nr:ribosome small subunit-dependent GTPase A [Peptococcaceae bacterium]
MIRGVIVKAYGGFFYVKSGKEVWECTLRGIFRHRKVDVMVGDHVELSTEGEHKGVIEKVIPRRNLLNRPLLANIDQAVIVFAIIDPAPSLTLLDRFLVQVGSQGIQPVICFNKIDLLKGQESRIINTYSAAGYKVINTSIKTGDGINDLISVLKEGTTVFAGPSGVGKSSLLNKVQPGLALKTGEIGLKIKRGKHTTRHVELLSLDIGGLVADTPGFSSLFVPEVKREELFYYFPEIEKYSDGCKYRGCLHNTEPHCAVKDALSQGHIDKGRYERYLEILAEIIEKERNFL